MLLVVFFIHKRMFLFQLMCAFFCLFFDGRTAVRAAGLNSAFMTSKFSRLESGDIIPPQQRNAQTDILTTL